MNHGENKVDILIPTFGRTSSLAVTLTSLIGQTFQNWRVVISEQNDTPVVRTNPEIQTIVRVLQIQGHSVEIHHHLPRRGLAEQRQFLLDQVHAPYALYLDDDVILEPWVIQMMLGQLEAEQCGFVGCSVIGPSYVHDIRPEQQKIEFWDGPVLPERITVGSPEWFRYKLHSAANVYHIQQRLKVTPDHPLRYKVAWVAVCVLFDANKLRAAGGFQFWEALPDEHSGEDVLAQWKVMAKFGGCGLLPSGVYHQELETTIKNREVDAPRTLILNYDETLHQTQGANG